MQANKLLTIFVGCFLVLTTLAIVSTNAAAVPCNSDESPPAVAAGESSIKDENAPTEKPASKPSITALGAGEIKKFIRTMQTTLEKAKPWVEEIEKEAKHFEETAKRFGEDVISRLGDFVDKLIGHDNHHSASNSTEGGTAQGSGDDGSTTTAPALDANEAPASESTSTTIATTTAKPNVDNVEVAPVTEFVDPVENEIAGLLNEANGSEPQICPDGFVADVNRICQRLHF